jgi:hypothetical protein
MNQVIGILVILNSIAICGAWAYHSPDTYKTPAAFAVMGMVAGVLISVSDRLGNFKAPGGFSISTVKEDAEAVAEFRKEAKVQKEFLDLIVREANAAKERIDKVADAADEAKKDIQEIRGATEISTLILQAQADSREAFIKLQAIAGAAGPYKEIAKTFIETIEDATRARSGSHSDTLWEELGIDPGTASIDDLKSCLAKVDNDHRLQVLLAIWNRDKGDHEIPMVDRMRVMIEEIKSGTTLTGMQTACDFAAGAANLHGAEPDAVLSWWRDHEQEYSGKTVCFVRYVASDNGPVVEVDAIGELPVTRVILQFSDERMRQMAQSQDPNATAGNRRSFISGLMLPTQGFQFDEIAPGHPQPVSYVFRNKEGGEYKISISQKSGKVRELAAVRKLADGRYVCAWRVFKMVRDDKGKKSPVEIADLRHVDEGFPRDADGKCEWIDSTSADGE